MSENSSVVHVYHKPTFNNASCTVYCSLFETNLQTHNKHELNWNLLCESVVLLLFFQYCAGQRFIAALSHTGGQARKN